MQHQCRHTGMRSVLTTALTVSVQHSYRNQASPRELNCTGSCRIILLMSSSQHLKNQEKKNHSSWFKKLTFLEYIYSLSCPELEQISRDTKSICFNPFTRYNISRWGGGMVVPDCLHGRRGKSAQSQQFKLFLVTREASAGSKQGGSTCNQVVISSFLIGKRWDPRNRKMSQM